MKKIFTTLLLFAAMATQAQQLPNCGFDADWVDCIPWTSKGNTATNGSQPDGWTISHVIGMSGTGATEVGSKVEGGYNGSAYAVNLTNTSNPLSSSQIVPAYMTLGTTWATSTGLIAIKNKDGGVFGGYGFGYRPDAIRFDYKRSHGTSKVDEPSVVCAYMWKGSTSQADVPGDNASSSSVLKKVTMTDRDRNILGMTTSQGGAVTKTDDFELIGYLTDGTNKYVSFGADDVTEWTEFFQEFKYETSSTPTKINVILSANDYFAGADAVGKNNSLIVDNVQLVYYSTLSKLSYGGALQTIPVAGGTLDLSHVEFDESALEYEFNGVSAKGVHSYDEESALLTITVSNDGADKDGLSNHIYYVQFGKPVITEYTNDLTVSVNGETTAPQATTIQLIKELDGTTSFALNNFVLGGEIPVGNIKLTDVQVDAAGNISAEQTITIAAGDDAAYDYWLGPDLGEVPVTLSAQLVDSELVADIDIDMTASLGQMIKVVFAPSVSYTDGDVLAIEPGLKNVVLNRQFNAGWSTICLPFNVDIIAFGEGAVAQLMEFTGADAGILYFSEATSIVANTPYLVNFANAVEGPLYFGVKVEKNLPVAVTNGDWKFVGTYTGIAAPGMDGMYGVTEVLDEEGYQAIRRGNSQASINATRAYFENISGTYMQKSMRISLGGETTGIEENMDAEGLFPADVYSMDGRLVRAAAENLDGLAKGIYVVKNVKILVK